MKKHSVSAVAFLFAVFAASAATAADYTVSVEPNYPPAQAQQVYQPLLTYLSKATGLKFVLRTSGNYHVFWRDLRGATQRAHSRTLARSKQRDLNHDARGHYAVRSPDKAGVAAHRQKCRYAAPVHGRCSLSSVTQSELRSRSIMMQRRRMSIAATLYIQNASATSSMPASMVVAMLGLRVRLTDAP